MDKVTPAQPTHVIKYAGVSPRKFQEAQDYENDDGCFSITFNGDGTSNIHDAASGVRLAKMPEDVSDLFVKIFTVIRVCVDSVDKYASPHFESNPYDSTPIPRGVHKGFFYNHGGVRYPHRGHFTVDRGDTGQLSEKDYAFMQELGFGDYFIMPAKRVGGKWMMNDEEVGFKHIFCDYPYLHNVMRKEATESIIAKMAEKKHLAAQKEKNRLENLNKNLQLKSEMASQKQVIEIINELPEEVVNTNANVIVSEVLDNSMALQNIILLLASFNQSLSLKMFTAIFHSIFVKKTNFRLTNLKEIDEISKKLDKNAYKEVDNMIKDKGKKTKDWFDIYCQQVDLNLGTAKKSKRSTTYKPRK
jgi:hypothetical protein